MLDVDHFKAINDAQGHLKWDAVLKALSVRLQQCLRETDVLARWGGEEFLIVAPETELDGAQRLAERCLGTVTGSPVADTALSATFGVTGVKAGDDVESLVGRADTALYEGKSAGRNRVLVH